MWLQSACELTPVASPLLDRPRFTQNHPRPFASRATRCFQASHVQLLPRAPTPAALVTVLSPSPLNSPFSAAALLTSPEGLSPGSQQGLHPPRPGHIHIRRGWGSAARKPFRVVSASPWRGVSLPTRTQHRVLCAERASDHGRQPRLQLSSASEPGLLPGWLHRLL